MNEQHVLHLIKNGDFRLTLHARQRMSERKISYSDIIHCASTGVLGVEDGKYKINGFDLDNMKMTIVCVEENGVLIITVF